MQAMNESGARKSVFKFRPWTNLLQQTSEERSGEQFAIRSIWLLQPQPYKNHVYTQVRASQNVLWKLHSKTECLVKASFHTRMSSESFIPYRNVLWKLHSTLSFLEPAEITCVVCRTPVCPSQNVLCFFIPHRYFQNQCRIMQRCGSQNGLLVLDSALTFSRTSNILEKTNQKTNK